MTVFPSSNANKETLMQKDPKRKTPVPRCSCQFELLSGPMPSDSCPTSLYAIKHRPNPMRFQARNLGNRNMQKLPARQTPYNVDTFRSLSNPLQRQTVLPTGIKLPRLPDCVCAGATELNLTPPPTALSLALGVPRTSIPLIVVLRTGFANALNPLL